MTKDFNRYVFNVHYSDLQSHIGKMETPYPIDYQRIDQKTEPVIERLSHFTNAKVVDVGSNFGMYSLLLAPLAKSVVGVELDSQNFKIANAVKDYFVSKGCEFSNLEFVNGAVTALTSLDYDALLMTLVLYHLTNDEVDMLIEDARKKVTRAMIQCRPTRGLRVSKGTLEYASKNSRFDGLYDIAGCIRFLEALGLKNIRIDVSPKMLGQEVFPVITAKV